MLALPLPSGTACESWGMRKRWPDLDLVDSLPEEQVRKMMKQLPAIDPDCMQRTRSKGWPTHSYVATKLEERKVVSRSVTEKVLRKIKKLDLAGR